jgi:hypothetical protein
MDKKIKPIDNLPAPTVINGPAEIIDLIWISVLGVVSFSRNQSKL